MLHVPLHIKSVIDRERFEPRSHFKSRLSLIVWVDVVLNRTVVIDVGGGLVWVSSDCWDTN